MYKGPFSLVVAKPPRGYDRYEIRAAFEKYGKLHGEGLRFIMGKKEEKFYVDYEKFTSAENAMNALNGRPCEELGYFAFQMQLSRDTRIKLTAMGIGDYDAKKVSLPERMPPGPPVGRGRGSSKPALGFDGKPVEPSAASTGAAEGVSSKRDSGADFIAGVMDSSVKPKKKHYLLGSSAAGLSDSPAEGTRIKKGTHGVYQIESTTELKRRFLKRPATTATEEESQTSNAPQPNVKVLVTEASARGSAKPVEQAISDTAEGRKTSTSTGDVEKKAPPTKGPEKMTMEQMRAENLRKRALALEQHSRQKQLEEQPQELQQQQTATGNVTIGTGSVKRGEADFVSLLLESSVSDKSRSDGAADCRARAAAVPSKLALDRKEVKGTLKRKRKEASRETTSSEKEGYSEGVDSTVALQAKSKKLGPTVGDGKRRTEREKGGVLVESAEKPSNNDESPADPLAAYFRNVMKECDAPDIKSTDVGVLLESESERTNEEERTAVEVTGKEEDRSKERTEGLNKTVSSEDKTGISEAPTQPSRRELKSRVEVSEASQMPINSTVVASVVDICGRYYIAPETSKQTIGGGSVTLRIPPSVVKLAAAMRIPFMKTSKAKALLEEVARRAAEERKAVAERKVLDECRNKGDEKIGCNSESEVDKAKIDLTVDAIAARNGLKPFEVHKQQTSQSPTAEERSASTTAEVKTQQKKVKSSGLARKKLAGSSDFTNSNFLVGLLSHRDSTGACLKTQSETTKDARATGLLTGGKGANRAVATSDALGVGQARSYTASDIHHYMIEAQNELKRHPGCFWINDCLSTSYEDAYVVHIGGKFGSAGTITDVFRFRYQLRPNVLVPSLPKFALRAFIADPCSAAASTPKA